MKQKVFTSEKVRELAKVMSLVGIKTRNNYEYELEKWLEQNQPEPVVVGLSDEQVCQLADCINDADYEHHFKSKYAVITEWLKTQTFAKPNTIAAELYKNACSDYDSVREELEQLKSQQFTPNWDDAPVWANWLAQDNNGAWTWFDTKPNWVGDRWNAFMRKSKFASGIINWQQTLQQRPKTTPRVPLAYGAFFMSKIWRFYGLQKIRCSDWCCTEKK